MGLDVCTEHQKNCSWSIRSSQAEVLVDSCGICCRLLRVVGRMLLMDQVGHARADARVGAQFGFGIVSGPTGTILNNIKN